MPGGTIFEYLKTAEVNSSHFEPQPLGKGNYICMSRHPNAHPGLMHAASYRGVLGHLKICNCVIRSGILYDAACKVVVGTPSDAR